MMLWDMGIVGNGMTRRGVPAHGERPVLLFRRGTRTFDHGQAARRLQNTRPRVAICNSGIMGASLDVVCISVHYKARKGWFVTNKNSFFRKFWQRWPALRKLFSRLAKTPLKPREEKGKTLSCKII